MSWGNLTIRDGDILRFPCSFCGVEAERWCLTKAGEPAVNLHTARYYTPKTPAPSPVRLPMGSEQADLAWIVRGPTFGFGCGPGCDCCTPFQQRQVFLSQQPRTTENGPYSPEEKPHG